MPRPDFITNEDILRWSEQINEELPPEMAEDALLREVCLAGKWMVEQLQILHCPDEICIRIQYTAARLSFGRDPWVMHQQLLHGYQDDELIFEPEPDLDYN
jgi:hypothetical protein